MALKPQAERLRSTLEQLRQCEVRRDRRRLVALARDAALAVDMDVPIELPTGERLAQRGYRLRSSAKPPMWLLADGRLLVLPSDAPAEPAVLSPADPQVNLQAVTSGLRWLALVAYLRGEPLALRSGLEALATVSELLAVAWEVDWRGREVILAALVEAMAQRPNWERCVPRLKTGFERAMVDPVPAVRAAATRGLLRLTMDGHLADRDAARTLELLLHAPHPDVQGLALQLLADAPPETLRRHRQVLAAALRESLLAPDRETRDLAARIAAQVHDDAEDVERIAALKDADADRRAAALSRLADKLDDTLPVALPYLLDAATDPAATVRQAALNQLRPMLEVAESTLRERIVIGLLESNDPQLVEVALAHVAGQASLSSSMVKALRQVVARPHDSRGAAVAVLSRAAIRSPEPTMLAVLLELLRHADPGVRMAALQALAAEGELGDALREELEFPLADRLRDAIAPVRLEAARAVLRLGYQDGRTRVLALALDPDPLVRHQLPAVLREAGALEEARLAERRAENAGVLLALTSAEQGEGRIRWLAALDRLATERPPGALELLAAVLKAVPAAANDPFAAFAKSELVDRIVALGTEPGDVLHVCRWLLEPPAAVEHAAALAGRRAAADPLALDFLWTLHAHLQGAAAEAARRELASIAGQPKSAAVRAWLAEALDRETVPARRDILRLILTGRESGRSSA